MRRRIQGIWFQVVRGLLLVPSQVPVPSGYVVIEREQSPMGDLFFLCREVA